MTLPLQGGPVVGLTRDEFPDWQEPYLREPERLAEGWMALHEPGGPGRPWLGGGLCWSGMAEQAPADPRGFALATPVHTLAPGGQLILEPTYLVAGPVDAAAVRGHWRRLFGSAAPVEMGAPRPPLVIEITPPVLVARDGVAHGEVTLINHNSFTESGTVTVSCPGWESTFDGGIMRSDESTPAHQSLTLHAHAGGLVSPEAAARTIAEDEDARRLNAVPHPAPAGHTAVAAAPAMPPAAASLRADQATGEPARFLHTGLLTYHGRLADVASRFTVLALAPGAGVDVQAKGEPDGGGLWQVTNGRLTFTVAPAYAAAVTDLSLDGAPQLALADSYPQPGAFSWTSPWYGGIHPAVRRWRPGDPSFLLDAGALHDEPSQAQIVRRPGASGVAWEGVRVVTEGRHEGYAGLTQAVEYLTLPGAPLLAVVLELANDTTAPFPVQEVLSVFLRPWGVENGDVLYQRDGQLVRRHAAEHSFNAPEADWAAAAVRLPGSREGVVGLVQGTPGLGVVTGVQFARMGPHLFGALRAPVAPRGVRRTVRYLTFSSSVDEALHYMALVGLGELP
jgi:hypothetical protein